MEVRFISNITKVYPDMIQVTIYKSPYPVITGTHFSKIRKILQNYIPSESSISRTKRTIQDIVLCNDFDLFATFTFDKKKHDRYNANHCKCVISKWLEHQRLKNPEFAYLIVPELHKDGAIHFHALLKNFTGSMKDSGHKSNGRIIYNITSYRAGFSTAVRIEEKAPVASYIRKYITKDMSILYGRKRYFCSRNLKRPLKEINSPRFRDTQPLFRHHERSTDYYDIYSLDIV